VNIDQLMDSLSENDPSPASVLARVHTKRRAARQRMYADSGGLAVVVVAILGGFLLRGVNLGGSTASSSSAARQRMYAASGGLAVVVVAILGGFLLRGVNLGGSTASSSSAAGVAAGSAPSAFSGVNPTRAPKPAPAGQSAAATSGAGSGASCAAVSLKTQLAVAVQQGASVIIGYGRASGTSAAARAAQGTSYYQVTLRSVRTLAGPAIRSGSTAWVQGPPGVTSAGTGVSPEGQSLWAVGGEFFGVVKPAATSGAPTGPKLRLAPVADGQVIFSLDECWSVAGLPNRPYHGAVSSEPPATSNGDIAGFATGTPGTVTRNLYAVPLADAEKAVPKG
jgi:hypothetical protein